MQHVVFRHLLPTRSDRFQSRESVGPVLNHDGKPLVFDDQRAAVEAAEQMTRANVRIGQDHCVNVRFTAGWIGEWK